jgi:hypothetical protein
VLGAQLTRVWGAEFMAGVLDAAKANDINVVYFAGGKPLRFHLLHDGGDSYGLYDLIKPGQFDGILLSADLAHGTALDDIKKFFRIFANPRRLHPLRSLLRV